MRRVIYFTCRIIHIYIDVYLAWYSFFPRLAATVWMDGLRDVAEGNRGHHSSSGTGNYCRKAEQPRGTTDSDPVSVQTLLKPGSHDDQISLTLWTGSLKLISIRACSISFKLQTRGYFQCKLIYKTSPIPPWNSTMHCHVLPWYIVWSNWFVNCVLDSSTSNIRLV